MNIKYVKKGTTEPLPELEEGKDYMLFDNELYIAEFCSSQETADGGFRLYNGEAWLVEEEWDILVTLIVKL